MKIYHYNSINGEYLSEAEADESPLSPDEFLIPANATVIPPPIVGVRQCAVFNGNDWILAEDWRGLTLTSTVTGEVQVIQELGEKPANTTELPRPSAHHEWQTDHWTLNLPAYKTAKIVTLEISRNTAIDESVTSSALGTPNTYAAKSANRQFLNDLVTLNAGGKFTCIDAAGIKARRVHTAAQLTQLAVDYQAAIEAKFEHFEALVSQVNSATTQAEIDAINW